MTGIDDFRQMSGRTKPCASRMTWAALAAAARSGGGPPMLDEQREHMCSPLLEPCYEDRRKS